MANSTISSIGGVIQGNWEDEFFVSAYGNASEKAGSLVGISAAGAIVECGSQATDDEFVGIVVGAYDTDLDTAPAATSLCTIVIPQSGHLYGCLTDDLSTALAGEPLIHSDTDGQLKAGGNIEAIHVARKYKANSGDTVAIVIWGV